MRGEEGLVHLDAQAGLLQRDDTAVLPHPKRLAHQLVAEQVDLRDVSLEVAAVVDGGEHVDARGHVEASAAMRSVSVMPPVFERSGCRMVMTRSSITRENSKRV